MADGATMDETSGSKKGTWCKKKAPGPREQRCDPDASGDSANPKNELDRDRLVQKKSPPQPHILNVGAILWDSTKCPSRSNIEHVGVPGAFFSHQPVPHRGVQYSPGWCSSNANLLSMWRSGGFFFAPGAFLSHCYGRSTRGSMTKNHEQKQKK